jgi:hypothetical protein
MGLEAGTVGVTAGTVGVTGLEVGATVGGAVVGLGASEGFTVGAAVELPVEEEALYTAGPGMG